MKFSVLLPTRNRLQYLKYAIASVMQQEYADWEIIVSDNCSEEDVEGYVRNLSDDRIKYYRTSTFFPVTDNWNNALEKSSGDYVVMLGDDDSLLQGYFNICVDLIEQYRQPDLIYHSAMQYTYPKVLPGGDEGSLIKPWYATFLIGKKTPFILDKDEAHELVKTTLNFHVVVNFNAQHSLVSRSLIKKMQRHGPFYQSPYPDYYSTVAMLLESGRILAVPYSLIVIGVSPKSFGCFFMNNREKEGVKFLQNLHDQTIHERIVKWFFPGTDMNTSWLMAMETVRQNFDKEYALKVNYRKYRFLQILHGLRKIVCDSMFQRSDFFELLKSLFWWEKILYFIPYLSACYMRKFPTPAWIKTRINTLPYRFSHASHGETLSIAGKYDNILEVFQKVKIDKNLLSSE